MQMGIRSTAAKIQLIRLLLPIALILFGTLYLSLVDLDALEAKSSICIYKALSGHECLGCGSFKAIAAVLQMKFTRAYSYNPLVVVIFPLLSIVVMKYLRQKLSALCSIIKKGESDVLS